MYKLTRLLATGSHVGLDFHPTICPNDSDLQKYGNSAGNPTRSREENLIIFWTFLFSKRNDFLEREMSKHNWGRKPFPVEKPA